MSVLLDFQPYELAKLQADRKELERKEKEIFNKLFRSIPAAAKTFMLANGLTIISHLVRYGSASVEFKLTAEPEQNEQALHLIVNSLTTAWEQVVTINIAKSLDDPQAVNIGFGTKSHCEL